MIEPVRRGHRLRRKNDENQKERMCRARARSKTKERRFWIRRGMYYQTHGLEKVGWEETPTPFAIAIGQARIWTNIKKKAATGEFLVEHRPWKIREDCEERVKDMEHDVAKP